ncbi:hypothetical protein SAMN05216388_10527 [Halorientalis persicus]|uniref:Uncharacterized protein n=1 Tax=Halorientalis persicus TaxID=1367881 RepID=A0A1H8W914_9EURY|nr:hypothetical protein SAMN05216388_10527 [Halorientalis persicus]
MSGKQERHILSAPNSEYEWFWNLISIAPDWGSSSVCPVRVSDICDVLVPNLKYFSKRESSRFLVLSDMGNSFLKNMLEEATLLPTKTVLATLHFQLNFRREVKLVQVFTEVFPISGLFRAHKTP